MHNIRVLYLGENWYGSCARACGYSLRRIGCNVLDIDAQTFFPSVQTWSGRVLRRLMRGALIEAYNNEILRRARDFAPDILLVFKGYFVQAKTIRTLRRNGIRCYNFYPDRLIFAGEFEREAIPEYDCLFDTKRHWDGDVSKRITVRERCFIPHGYDPEIHNPIAPDDRDKLQYGCDVGVVAGWSPRKQAFAEALVRLRPNLDLKIWGENWRRTGLLSKHVQGYGVHGAQYARAVRCFRINLALLGINKEIQDETTTRTFEIPACGGFMLHERTEELCQLYHEDEEVASYGSPEEALEKIDYYLKDPAERNEIATAGRLRCVPAYSYDNRMAEILRWHCNQVGMPMRPRDAAGEDTA